MTEVVRSSPSCLLAAQVLERLVLSAEILSRRTYRRSNRPSSSCRSALFLNGSMYIMPWHHAIGLIGTLSRTANASRGRRLETLVVGRDDGKSYSAEYDPDAKVEKWFSKINRFGLCSVQICGDKGGSSGRPDPWCNLPLSTDDQLGKSCATSDYETTAAAKSVRPREPTVAQDLLDSHLTTHSTDQPTCRSLSTTTCRIFTLMRTNQVRANGMRWQLKSLLTRRNNPMWLDALPVRRPSVEPQFSLPTTLSWKRPSLARVEIANRGRAAQECARLETNPPRIRLTLSPSVASSRPGSGGLKRRDCIPPRACIRYYFTGTMPSPVVLCCPCQAGPPAAWILAAFYSSLLCIHDTYHLHYDDNTYNEGGTEQSSTDHPTGYGQKKDLPIAMLTWPTISLSSFHLSGLAENDLSE
nr:hypothetical protein CFP56_57620 [Quercus suber]